MFLNFVQVNQVLLREIFVGGSPYKALRLVKPRGGVGVLHVTWLPPATACATGKSPRMKSTTDSPLKKSQKLSSCRITQPHTMSRLGK